MCLINNVCPYTIKDDNIVFYNNLLPVYPSDVMIVYMKSKTHKIIMILVTILSQWKTAQVHICILRKNVCLK